MPVGRDNGNWKGEFQHDFLAAIGLLPNERNPSVLPACQQAGAHLPYRGEKLEHAFCLFSESYTLEHDDQHLLDV